MCKKIPFSIIIPAYNAHNTVQSCLNSILNQSFKNFECIIVNDGSTDDTLNICREVLNNDIRFRIINQNNQGPAVARENAIRICKGKYLVFVDSDDFLISNALENLYEYVLNNDTDLLFYDLYGIYDNISACITIPFDASPIKQLEMLFEGKITGWLPSKIIKKEYWERCQIKIVPNCFVMEDVLITAQLLFYNPKMSKLKKCLYVYRRDNPNSLSGSLDGRTLFPSAIDNILEIHKIAVDINKLNEIDLAYGRFIMKAKINFLNTRNLKAGLNFLNKYHRKLKYYPNLKFKKFIYYLIFNFGFITKYFYSNKQFHR